MKTEITLSESLQRTIAHEQRVLGLGGAIGVRNCTVTGIPYTLLQQQPSLVILPSGYSEGKIHSIVPNNILGDLTFTRASDAWTRNEFGILEQACYNLLTQSNNLSDVSWVKIGAGTGSAPIVTPAYTPSPNEVGTASRVQLDLNGGTGGGDISYITKAVGSENGTFSVYLKSNTVGCVVYIRSGSTSLAINVTIEWQRFEVYTSTSVTLVQIGLRGGNHGGITNSDSADISFYGAQLNTGATAKPYFKTTDRLNVPRLNFPTNGGCSHWLVEPQRTNKQTNSESIDITSSYVLSSEIIISSNIEVSPSGLQNADKIIPTINNTPHLLRTLLATDNGFDIISCFVKASGYNFVQLQSWSNGNDYVNFDLINGVVSAVGTTTIYGIEPFGNGWYRIYANVKANGSGLVGLGIITSGSSVWAQSFSGNGIDGVLVWGVQIEEGSSATSYIPTSGSTVTRLADVITNNNIESIIPSGKIIKIYNELGEVFDVKPRINPLQLPNGNISLVIPSTDDEDWMYLTTGSTTTINLQMNTKSGGQWQVDFGDGTVYTVNNSVTQSHTYASSYSGIVRVRSLHPSKLQDFDGIFSTSGAWNFDLELLFSQSKWMTFQAYFSGGSMTITGDIAALSNLTNTAYFLGNAITLTGDIVALSNLTYDVRFQGNSMTLIGDISSLSNLTNRVLFLGNSMTLSYSATTWATIPSNSVYFNLATGYLTTSAEVDNLLIDLNATGATGTSTIDLRFNNAPRTTASDAAVSALTSRGYTVLTN